MNRNPLRLLLFAYVAALSGATAAAVAGLSLLASIALFWLGGAAIALALAAIAGARAGQAADAAQADIEAWEADRAADVSAAQPDSRRPSRASSL